jgi:hypothetical protein
VCESFAPRIRKGKENNKCALEKQKIEKESKKVSVTLSISLTLFFLLPWPVGEQQGRGSYPSQQLSLSVEGSLYISVDKGKKKEKKKDQKKSFSLSRSRVCR